MAISRYSREHFPVFAISCCSRPGELRRMLCNAFVHYTRFCERLLQYQQNWAGLVLLASKDGDDGDDGAFEEIALVFQISLCLHPPRLRKLEILAARNTPAFIYTSQELLRRFTGKQCISPSDGGPALACMIPPHMNEISIQEMLLAHDRVGPGRYNSEEDIAYFIAIQLSDWFVEDSFHEVEARDGTRRTCRFFRRAGDPQVSSSSYDIVAFGRALFHNRLSSETALMSSPCCVDLLYDYETFLQETEAHEGIGRYPADVTPPNVAIVGGGLSGLVAAAELVRAGIKDISFFPLRPEINGDVSLQSPYGDDHHLVASFGVAPFPSNQICLGYYLSRYRIATDAHFPRLGKDNIAVYYRRQAYMWQARQGPPPIFQRVYTGWNALLRKGYHRNGRKLVPPVDITCMLRKRDFGAAEKAWQAWHQEFGDFSFYTALAEIFAGPDPPGGEVWQRPSDFEAFGMLRFGFGRASNCYRAGFAEILRWVINGYEEDQHLIIGGTQLLEARLRAEIFQNAHVRLQSDCRPIRCIGKKEGKPQVCLENGQAHVFDRVVISGNTESIKILPGVARSENFFSYDVPHARRTSLASVTSGLFMVTNHKFWINTDFPVAIWTDGLVRELYCLDIGLPKGAGLVLFRYALKDDACRLCKPCGKERRCRDLVQELSVVFPEFAKHLVPVNEDYCRYVFQSSPTDGFDAISTKFGDPGQDEYTSRFFYQFLDANSMEKDEKIYSADSNRSFAAGCGEGAVQTGINAACAVVQGTGGMLVAFNPSNCMLRKYSY